METTIGIGREHGQSMHSHEVTISLDGVARQIERGNYVVAELKRVLLIDSCRDLDEVVCGELRPLEDSEKTHIKGGETFVSHVKCGASS
jgi:hypothetical protein